MVILYFLFPNNHTSSGHHVTTLPADVLIVNSSRVQLYILIPDVLWQVFGLIRGGGDAGIEEIDSVEKRALYT